MNLTVYRTFDAKKRQIYKKNHDFAKNLRDFANFLCYNIGKRVAILTKKFRDLTKKIRHFAKKLHKFCKIVHFHENFSVKSTIKFNFFVLFTKQ